MLIETEKNRHLATAAKKIPSRTIITSGHGDKKMNL